MLGADAYQTLAEMDAAQARGVPPIGIGADAIIHHAIIDKNARIGRGVKILNEARVQEADGNGFYIREGIVIVPKGGVLPDGTVI
jgi:glucose-1-phosphate adenylyltransferase